MKKLLVAALVGASMTPAMSQANGDVNETLANICTVVANDDKSSLRKKLQKVKSDFKMRLGDVYPGVSCGGKSLIRHATLKGAHSVGPYMVGQMRKSDLNTPEGDGQTIKQWIESNGYSDTATGKKVIGRAG